MAADNSDLVRAVPKSSGLCARSVLTITRTTFSHCPFLAHDDATWRGRGHGILGSDAASLPLPEVCSGRLNCVTPQILGRRIISYTVVHKCQLRMFVWAIDYDVSALLIPRKVANFCIANKCTQA